VGMQLSTCSQAPDSNLVAGAIANLETLVLTNNRIADLKVRLPSTGLVSTPHHTIPAQHGAPTVCMCCC
jgi:hypothetical protein